MYVGGKRNFKLQITEDADEFSLDMAEEHMVKGQHSISYCRLEGPEAVTTREGGGGGGWGGTKWTNVL